MVVIHISELILWNEFPSPNGNDRKIPEGFLRRDTLRRQGDLIAKFYELHKNLRNLRESRSKKVS
jgi:hypothetical protein